MKCPLKYRFYPSLLDKFQRYLDTSAEEYIYYDEAEGKYHRNYNEADSTLHYSEEEVGALLRQELIDAINRVPYDSEAADKGTAFNDVIDLLLAHGNRRTKIYFRDNYVVPHVDGLIDPSTGKVIGGDVEYEEIDCPHIEAVLGDRVFRFDTEFCQRNAPYFTGSLAQVFVSAPIETRYGNVELYGFIDELIHDRVFDIKTTSSYTFGKYSKGWQRYVYPYCLIESGKCTNIRSFEYSVFVLKGGTGRNPIITGTFYPELYTYNHTKSKQQLQVICERFIEFLEDNKEMITDKKIFNQV